MDSIHILRIKIIFLVVTIMDSLENGRKEYVQTNINLSVRGNLVRLVLLTNALLGTIGGVLVKNVIA